MGFSSFFALSFFFRGGSISQRFLILTSLPQRPMMFSGFPTLTSRGPTSLAGWRSSLFPIGSSFLVWAQSSWKAFVNIGSFKGDVLSSVPSSFSNLDVLLPPVLFSGPQSKNDSNKGRLSLRSNMLPLFSCFYCRRQIFVFVPQTGFLCLFFIFLPPPSSRHPPKSFPVCYPLLSDDIKNFPPLDPMNGSCTLFF